MSEFIVPMNIPLHGQNILPDLTNKDFERGGDYHGLFVWVQCNG